MNWFIQTFASSIGKKITMALTGLFFCLFLTTHLIGNLTIYGGKDAFNAYSERLHSFALVIHVIEAGLVVFAVLHISMAAILYFENLRARPVRYVMKKNAGGRTLSSATMPYTGLLLLIFVLIHLFMFTFVDHTEQTVFQLATRAFSNLGYVIFYIFTMVVAAFHVKHGLWSAFQTIGANHPKYMPFIKGVSLVFSLVIGIGFSSVPVFVLFST